MHLLCSLLPERLDTVAWPVAVRRNRKRGQSLPPTLPVQSIPCEPVQTVANAASPSERHSVHEQGCSDPQGRFHILNCMTALKKNQKGSVKSDKREKGQMAPTVTLRSGRSREPGTRKSTLVSHMNGRGPNAWVIIHCFPRCLGKELAGKWSIWELASWIHLGWRPQVAA